MNARVASRPLRYGLTRPSREGSGALRRTLAVLCSLLINLSLLAGSFVIVDDLPTREPPGVAVELAVLGRSQSVTEAAVESLEAPAAELAREQEDVQVPLPLVEAETAALALDAAPAELAASEEAAVEAERSVERIRASEVEASEVEAAEVEASEVKAAVTLVPAGLPAPSSKTPPEPAAVPRPILAESVLAESILAESILAESLVAESGGLAPNPIAPVAPPALAQAVPQGLLQDSAAPATPEPSLPAAALEEATPEPAAPVAVPTSLLAEPELAAVRSDEPRLAEAPPPVGRIEPSPPKPADLPPQRAALRERAAAAAAAGARPPSPEALLARIEALKDEALQAEEKPKLWSVIRAVRRQIARCWALDGSGRSRRLRVDIDVVFGRDGSLRRARIQQAGEVVVDEAFRKFATGARQALSRCSPFDLPDESYDLWQRFTMRFVASGPPS